MLETVLKVDEREARSHRHERGRPAVYDSTSEERDASADLANKWQKLPLTRRDFSSPSMKSPTLKLNGSTLKG